MRGVREFLSSGLRPAGPSLTNNDGATKQGFVFNLDVCSSEGVVGWVVHPSGIRRVRVLRRDRPVGDVRWGEERADVAAALPELFESLHSGFKVAFPEDTFAVEGPQELVIECTAQDSSVLRVAREIWPVSIAGGDPVRRDTALSPLPTDVMVALHELKPSEYDLSVTWSPEKVERAIEDVGRILASHAAVKPVLRYAHFLRSMTTGFEFIGSHFDRINRLVDTSAKDFKAVASSPQEMLCIANHLYVLRSRGLSSGLVECGSFKGFSTCCLSHACEWLGLPLHVFDSFEGLPATPGEYYQEGDFCGTIEEVTDNLGTFGRPDVVQLHRGFFAETVPHFSEPFSCIWMDVDLPSSARDVMALFPGLPPESCVFSHECPPGSFVASRPQPIASDVLPPIIDAFGSIGADPVGTHLIGFLGAVWSRRDGVPVLGYDEIAYVTAATQD